MKDIITTEGVRFDMFGNAVPTKFIQIGSELYEEVSVSLFLYQVKQCVPTSLTRAREDLFFKAWFLTERIVRTEISDKGIERLAPGENFDEYSEMFRSL